MGDENNEGLSPEQIESNYLKHSKEHALRASLKEGCNQSIGVNMSSGFLTPLLLALGGNSFHVGLMTSLNGLFDPAGEIYGSKLMEKHSRKKLWMHAKFWVVLLQLPTLMLIYFAWKGILAPILPWALLAIWGVIIPFIYGAGYVSFLSWLGDLVPQERKGKFFASRNRIIGMVGLVTLIVSGFLLDLFKTRGYILLGFTFLFAFAVIFRMASVHYTNKIFNPYFRVKKQSYFSLIAFLKRFDNFGKFTVFQFFFYFAGQSLHREGLHLLFSGGGRDRHLVFDLAVDLNDDLQLAGGHFGLIRRGPGGFGKRRFVAAQLPQLFRDVRRERKQELENGVDRFLGNFIVQSWIQIKSVHQFHDRRNGRVEAEIRFDVFGDARDGHVALAFQILGAHAVAVFRLAFDGFADRELPHAVHKTPHAADLGVGPFQLLGGRGREQDKQAAGIGPVFADHVRRVDHVAARFGHRGAAERHHALGEQRRERLVGGHHAHVADHFVEKAGVNQMHAGVFDAADVLVNGNPGIGRFFIERQMFIFGVGVTQVIPRGVDKGVHGVGVALGRALAGRAGGVYPIVRLRERRSALAGEFNVRGQFDGQLIQRNGFHSAFWAVHDRNGRSPIPLAREQPVP